jgi:multiple antibiotic resistance protein
MIAFLFLGEQILTLIGIDINSFAVAGSFIIFFISLELILGITLFREESPDTASIVPIAFPLIAGAGTLTSILTLRAEYDLLNIIVAIIVNMIVVYIVLKSSGFLEKFLGNSGLNVLRKIFGVVLMAIAVKIFSANIQNLF